MYDQQMNKLLHPYLDHAGILAFAHRGGAGEHPENTMRAFESAAALGYRYLETDARLTRDGVLVAFHDERLERVSDGEGLVGALPWSELSRVRVGGEPVVRLDELLESFPEARFHIDIKHWVAVNSTLELISRMGCAARICIGSTSDLLLGRVRKWRAGGQGVCTATGPLGVVAIKGRVLGLPLGSDADCVQVPCRHRGIPVVTQIFIDTCHALGKPVHVWTIDDPEQAQRLIAMGVDGLMTDQPSMLKTVLVGMGRW